MPHENKFYDVRFLEIYEKLNPEQKQSIEHIYGPVLVLAGPGTGKTQMLSARIGYLLMNTDTRPENILCLTYTDAGAVAMRERLISFIGPDAHKVKISTFHSFCNEIILQNPDEFPNKNTEQVSDIEKIELIHEIIDSYRKENDLLDPKDRYSITKELLDFFDKIKQEALDISEQRQKAMERIAFVNTSPEFEYKRASGNNQKGDKKIHEIKKEVLKMSKFLTALELFEIYVERFSERGWYDYSDMILWVLEKFKTDYDFLLNYQERYQFILVDEFQDTSGSQNEIIRHLLSYDPDGIPNVFVVGDDDQAIYRFQGANIDNIVGFANRYRNHLFVQILKQNYRSSALILESAKQLISYNEKRLVNQPGFEHLSKELIASGENAHVAQAPVIRVFDNPLQENTWIAQQLVDRYHRNEDLSKIAIMYRKHSQADVLLKYFIRNNIPVQIQKSLNILDEPIIQNVIHALEYISAEMRRPFSGDDYLFTLLHAPWWENSPEEISRFYGAYISNKKESRKSFRSFLKERIDLNQYSLFDESHKLSLNFVKSFRCLEELIVAAVNSPLKYFLEKFFNHAGISDFLLRNNMLAEFEYVINFYDFLVHNISSGKATSLKEALVMISKMKMYGIGIEHRSYITQNKGVVFTSVHGAKGLEYDEVFLIGATKNAWLRGNTSGRISFPPVSNEEKQKNSEEDMEEFRRLFYVALTRAKKSLIVSYSRSSSGKEQAPLAFLSEFKSAAVEQEYIDVSALNEAILKAVAMESVSPEAISHNIVKERLVDRFLNEYSISATHLNNYIKCPVSFYYDIVLRAPAPPGANDDFHMNFGSAIHDSLQNFVQRSRGDDKITITAFQPESVLIEIFKTIMENRVHYFEKRRFDEALEYGEKVLSDYYRGNIGNWSKVIASEKNFVAVWEGVRMNGRLDKIEFDGNAAVIVDYKTGRSDKAKEKIKAPASLDVFYEDAIVPDDGALYGSTYWRQAVFYKLLMDNEPARKYRYRHVEFDFVEADKQSGQFVKFPVYITEDQELAFKALLKKVWQAIHDKRFENGCNATDCFWCNFARTIRN